MWLLRICNATYFGIYLIQSKVRACIGNTNTFIEVLNIIKLLTFRCLCFFSFEIFYSNLCSSVNSKWLVLIVLYQVQKIPKHFGHSPNDHHHIHTLMVVNQ